MVAVVRILILSFFVLYTGCTIQASIIDLNSNIVDQVKSTPDPVLKASCDPLIIDQFGGGNGSTVDPYRICSIQQWDYFSAQTSLFGASFKLEADLDFSAKDITTFKSIGDAGINSFTGTFDGDNHKISNIVVSPGAQNFAIFISTSGSPVIKNLKLDQIQIIFGSGTSAALINTHNGSGSLTLSNLTYTNGNVGLIKTSAGPLDASDITISNSNLENTSNTGLLIGAIADNIKLDRVTVSGLDILTFGTPSRLGGLIGFAYGGMSKKVTVNVQNTTVNIVKFGSGGNYKIGGVIGSIEDGDFAFNNVNVVVSTSIQGSSNGGILGSHSKIFQATVSGSIDNSSFQGIITEGNAGGGGLIGSIVSNSLNISNSYSKANVSTFSGYAGGLIGYFQVANSTISNSYAIGNITQTSTFGSGTAGGLISNSPSGNLSLQSSFFAGSVTGNYQVGCVIARSSGVATFTDIYFDSSTCSKSAVNSAAATGVAGLATSMIQTMVPFSNWSTTVWSFANSIYPKLLREL